MHSVVCVVAAGICLIYGGAASAVEPEWTSPDNRYRLLLTVDPNGIARTHSPTGPMRINFQQELADQGGSGTFDEHTIEVIAYNQQGQPLVYDAGRSGYEQYLIPWHIEKYYGIQEVDFTFVMTDHNHRQYAFYFDNAESGHGRPDRYQGLVGNGDLFHEEYKRREIGPSKLGDMADLDGDGDLDIFCGGVESCVYCWESLYSQTGQHRYVFQGKLTSGGQVLNMPHAASNRSWLTVTFHDWDGDGDPDLFPSCTDSSECGEILYYRNTTSENGGQLTFDKVGALYSQNNQSLGGKDCGNNWFPTPTFVDWDGDGDGLKDIVVAKFGGLYLHRNLGPNPGGGVDYLLADGVKLQADGADIGLLTPRVECVDMDGDADLDLVATTFGNSLGWYNTAIIMWYKNIGTRQNPQFADPVVIGQLRHCYSGIKVGDFYGNDGLLDIAVGTYWLVNEKHGYPKSYGGLLKNLGPLDNPSFEVVLSDAGSLYTEGFQTINAGQQNGVRRFDLDGDGDHDLLASTVDGFILFYRNIKNNLYPIFAAAEKLMVGGANPYPVEVTGPEGGYARHDMADWDNDGFIDLVVGDEEARVFIFLNDGLGNDPPTFQPGYHLYANNKPLDCLKRGSPLVCDWNNDGRKDLVFGMTPKQTDYETPYDWPAKDGNKADDEGFLYYRNTGTDADPVLAYPSWVQAGGQIIIYSRPNMGNFVDWDGDGIKDFIGCHFENNIRFYRNTGSGGQGAEPQLNPAAGDIIVEPPCKTQMISGADVVDWRGDGDLDIITGMGHGGGGLIYYERDYIEDWQNNSYPTVSVGLLPDDTNPPDNVNHFLADKQSDTEILLNWFNPADTDYTRTMVRYRTDTYPTSITDGQLVCDIPGVWGDRSTFTHTVAAGQDHYYTAFACDFAGNYASGSTTKAVMIWCNEHFDDYVISDLDGQGGWTKDPFMNSCYVRDIASADPTGYGVRIPYNVDSEATLANFGIIKRGYHRISLDMSRYASAARDHMEISGNDNIITAILWNNNYQILTGPGDTYTDLVISPTGLRWYHVEIGIDLDVHTIDAWADGVQKVFSQPFYQLTSQADRINLTGYISSGNSAYFDNLLGIQELTRTPCDYDFDQDADQEDFGYMQICFSGDGILTGSGCENADWDNDFDVDQEDIEIFMQCMAGVNVQVAPNCAD